MRVEMVDLSNEQLVSGERDNRLHVPSQPTTSHANQVYEKGKL
mgnify:CR=1 FL=1